MPPVRFLHSGENLRLFRIVFRLCQNAAVEQGFELCKLRGMKARFPSVVTDDEDGTQYIEEYYEV